MKRSLFIVAVLLALAACNSKLDVTDPSASGIAAESVGHDMIVLGRQLEDPYSVKNVTKALQSLYPTKAAVVGSLEPTHYYVRFLLNSEADFNALDSLGVDLLDHPMDYEIVREGDWYHDPSIPEGDITWQYAAVPIDFEAPAGILCERLDDCYIIGSEPASTRATKASECIDWAAVEREAFRITGNELPENCVTRAGDTAKPSGRITILDPDYDSEPVGVAGVKVTCNVFVKVARAYTDEEGYYSMTSSFASDPRYRIVFSNRKGFNIGMNLILVKASVSTLGKHPATGCSIMVTDKSDDKLFSRCAVNNAAYEYCESCKYNGDKISLPPANLRIWILHKMRTSAALMFQQGVFVESELVSSLLGEYSFIARMLAPDVILGLGGYDSYSDIYGLVCHELSHASHFMKVGRDYWEKLATQVVTSFITSGGIAYGVGTETNAGYCAVAEMWAYYCQSVLYNERYPEPSKFFGTNYWFSPQILCYLDERGLGRFSIFQAMGGDVHTVDGLKDRLLSLYPEFRNTILQAFNRYE